MKKKNLEINESVLLTENQQSQIRGGGSRTRYRAEDGTKIKHISSLKKE